MADLDKRVEAQPADAAQARLARERALIAAAHADIASGLGIDEDDFEAWLDALDTDENAPAPKPKGSRV